MYHSLPKKTENESLQRKANNTESKNGASLMPPQSGASIQRKAETGLPEQVQTKMESAFNTSFSDVKIHTNSSKASEIGAQAFTQGNNVHFAQAKFNPSSQSGQQLIGHELSHVVQQREGRVKPTTQMKGVAINNDSSLESEADVQGAKAARGEAVQRKTNNVQSSPTHIAQAKPVQMARERRKNVIAHDYDYEYEQKINKQLAKGGRKRSKAVSDDTVATLNIETNITNVDRSKTQKVDIDNFNIGHAWVSLQYKDKNFADEQALQGFKPIGIKSLKKGRNWPFGFYPGDDYSEFDNYFNLTKPGEIVEPDTNQNSKSTISYDVNNQQIANLASFVNKNRKHYYSFTTYNCTHFALAAARAAGLNPPSGRGFGGFVMPSGLYQNARKAAQKNNKGMAYKVEDFDSLLATVSFYQSKIDSIMKQQDGILTAQQLNAIERLMNIGARYKDEIDKAGIKFVAPNNDDRDKLRDEFYNVADKKFPDQNNMRMTIDDMKAVLSDDGLSKFSKEIKLQFISRLVADGNYIKG
ncbi:MAG: DUF4157 domain-containing protein [Bernardetiaceae bacterium]|nr:DUF4157 domain-containing protein [Bernardetiaceae bacterium]